MFIPHKGEHMLFILRTVRERAERKKERRRRNERNLLPREKVPCPLIEETP
jgi:hypothetical protein